MPIEIENDTSEVMNALLRDYHMLSHEKIIIAARHRRTGILTAYWLKFVTNTAGMPYHGFTFDPDDAEQYEPGEAPRLLSEYTDLLENMADDFIIEDFKIVRIGAL
jgi:hypothetical protein